MPRRGRGVRKLRTTKEYRDERRRRAIGYLVRGGDIPTARSLAKRDGYDWNTSVWITALGHVLKGKA